MDARRKHTAIEEYQLHPLKNVGEGTFAFVLAAQLSKPPSPNGEARQPCATSSRLCALKVFKSKSSAVVQVAKREAQALSHLHGHPNIVQLSGAFTTGSGRPVLIMEFCSRSLHDVLRQHPSGLAAPSVKLLTWQLLQVLRFMHARNYMHRDLKPSNVLLTRGGIVKLCDFGLARRISRATPPQKMHEASTGRNAERGKDDSQPGLDTCTAATQSASAAGVDQLTPYVVTRWYRAPEILLGLPYGTASDIWSLGCTVAELATGTPLLSGTSTVDQIFRIWGMFCSLPSKNKPPPNTRPATAPPLSNTTAQNTTEPQREEQLNQSLSQRSIRHHRQFGNQIEGPLLDLLDAMLQTDPRVRSTAEELLAMPYFSDILEVIVGTELEQLYGKTCGAPPCCNSANSDADDAKSKSARENKETAAAPACVPAVATAAQTAAAEGSNVQYMQQQLAVRCYASASPAVAEQQREESTAGKVEGREVMCMREVINVVAMNDEKLGAGQLDCGEVVRSREQACGESACNRSLDGEDLFCSKVLDGGLYESTTAGPAEGGPSKDRPASPPPPIDEESGEVEDYCDATLPPPPSSSLMATFSLGLRDGGDMAPLDGGRGGDFAATNTSAATTPTVTSSAAHYSCGARGEESSCLPVAVGGLIPNKTFNETRDERLVLNGDDDKSSVKVEKYTRDGLLPSSTAVASTAGTIAEAAATAEMGNPSPYPNDCEGHIVIISPSSSIVPHYAPCPSIRTLTGSTARDAQQEHQQQQQQLRGRAFVQRILDFIHSGGPLPRPQPAEDGSTEPADAAPSQDQQRCTHGDDVDDAREPLHLPPRALPQGPCGSAPPSAIIISPPPQLVSPADAGLQISAANNNVVERTSELPKTNTNRPAAGSYPGSVTPVNMSLCASSLSASPFIAIAASRTTNKVSRSLSTTQQCPQSHMSVAAVQVGWLSAPGMSVVSSSAAVDSAMMSPAAGVGCCLAGCWGRRGSAGHVEPRGSNNAGKESRD